MVVKLFVLVCAFVYLCECQRKVPREWTDMFDEPTPQLCDVPTCSPPCQGAAPPRKCPTGNTTHCSSGCACITYCDTLNTVVCYETKHCERRRFMGGRRRKTTKSLRGRQ